MVSVLSSCWESYQWCLLQNGPKKAHNPFLQTGVQGVSSEGGRAVPRVSLWTKAEAGLEPRQNLPEQVTHVLFGETCHAQG